MHSHNHNISKSTFNVVAGTDGVSDGVRKEFMPRPISLTFSPSLDILVSSPSFAIEKQP